MHSKFQYNSKLKPKRQVFSPRTPSNYSIKSKSLSKPISKKVKCTPVQFVIYFFISLSLTVITFSTWQ